MHTRELITGYVDLFNKHGVDSVEADSFIEANKSNVEFVEIASISRDLKIALVAAHATQLEPCLTCGTPGHLRECPTCHERQCVENCYPINQYSSLSDQCGACEYPD